MTKKKPPQVRLVAAFTDFLEAYGKASDGERREFLAFITPQTRRDLLALAEALRMRPADTETSDG